MSEVSSPKSPNPSTKRTTLTISQRSGEEATLTVEWRVLTVGEYEELAGMIKSLYLASKDPFGISSESPDIYRRLIVSVDGYSSIEEVPARYVWHLIRHAIGSQMGSEEDRAAMSEIIEQIAEGRLPAGDPGQIHSAFEAILSAELHMLTNEVKREFSSPQTYPEMLNLVRGIRNTQERVECWGRALLKYELQQSDVEEELDHIDKDIRNLGDYVNRLKFDLHGSEGESELE